mmetsp:Transcript_33944/g.66259  ORF Transcript_33944/g.66259 Transcript_33944/m.66259 type:complete len:328 (+) Transcript_33944:834-1817(+)
MPPKGSVHQCCLAIVVTSIDVGTFRNQQNQDWSVALAGSFDQRSLTLLVSPMHVGRRAQEKISSFGEATASSLDQGCIPVVVPRLQVDPPPNQRPHQFSVAMPHGLQNRRVFVLVGQVGIGSGIEQDLDCLEHPSFCGLKQSRRSVHVDGVNVTLLGDHPLDAVCVAAPRRHHQRCLAPRPAALALLGRKGPGNVLARVHKAPHPFQIPHLARFFEGCGRGGAWGTRCTGGGVLYGSLWGGRSSPLAALVSVVSVALLQRGQGQTAHVKDDPCAGRAAGPIIEQTPDASQGILAVAGRQHCRESVEHVCLLEEPPLLDKFVGLPPRP